MNEIDIEKIDKLIAGELSSKESEELLGRIEKEEDLKIHYKAAKASMAAVEHQIAKETRPFLQELINREELHVNKLPRKRILYFTGIAASFLILIASVLTINLSHSDESLANNYNINAIAARENHNFDNENFKNAISLYFKGDFQNAERELTLIKDEDPLLNEYKSWLSLMIALKYKGSNSEDFQSNLRSILNNSDHEFNNEAQDLDKQLNLFWRTFVVKK